jgi:hypothetical protein
MVTNLIRIPFLFQTGLKTYYTDLIIERASAARYKNLDSNFEMKTSQSSVSSKETTETKFGLFAIDKINEIVASQIGFLTRDKKEH